jgi:hypothetical protein
MSVMFKGFKVPDYGLKVLQNRVKTVNICYSNYRLLGSITKILENNQKLRNM